MTSYALSVSADADIEGIARYSMAQWGVARAERYIMALPKALETPAEHPSLGRDVRHVRPGYFQFNHDKHAVFYEKTDYGVFIVRVLHQKQQPTDYL
jgi:toxin ParE1/3/4